jgi:hypothetical protein
MSSTTPISSASMRSSHTIAPDVGRRFVSMIAAGSAGSIHLAP